MKALEKKLQEAKMLLSYFEYLHDAVGVEETKQKIIELTKLVEDQE